MPRLSTNLSAAQLARRAQIGEERRGRTRARLLEAAYRLFAVHGADAPTIDDVIGEAQIGRGTFYNHFATRDELFRAVADEIATEINDVIWPAIKDLPDPAERLAAAFRMFVGFAVADETRGWILLRTLPLVGPLNDRMKTNIHSEFSVALGSGRFHAGSVEVATDLGIGLQIMTIHRLLVDRIDLTYIEQAAEMMLVALGMPADEASRIARANLAVPAPARPALARRTRSAKIRPDS